MATTVRELPSSLNSVPPRRHWRSQDQVGVVRFVVLNVGRSKFRVGGRPTWSDRRRWHEDRSDVRSLLHQAPLSDRHHSGARSWVRPANQLNLWAYLEPHAAK